MPSWIVLFGLGCKRIDFLALKHKTDDCAGAGGGEGGRGVMQFENGW